MLTTIQELEQEIEQFHKNIKDSNELIKVLLSVASLTKSQTESFEIRTQSLQDELTKLPPELSVLFKNKIEEFILEIHKEHQAYQTEVSGIMERYTENLQKNQSENVASLQQIQEQYIITLNKTNEAFSKQLHDVVESIQTIPTQLKDDSAQQYGAFLLEFEKVMNAHIAQISETENHVLELIQGLEEKYNAFVIKLEATNMDQLYKCTLDMNKSLNTKLGIALVGIAVAVIISIISLFI